MPIYEYQCQSCGHELEKLQRMSDAPLTDCPDCGEAKLNRLVSAAAFRLKGAGWYETDFKKEGKKNLHDSDDSKGPAKQESSDSKPGDKPGAKPGAKPVETKKAASKPANSTTGAA